MRNPCVADKNPRQDLAVPWEIRMPTRALMRPQKTPEGDGVLRAFSSRHFLKLIEDTGKVGFWSADLRTERLDASPGL